MITKNAQMFKRFLEQKDIHLEFVEDKDGDTIVDTTQTLDNGVKIRFFMIFDENDGMVRIYGLDFIQAINPPKRNQVLEMLNQLNAKYTYVKYVLNENSIQIESYHLFEDNFNPEIIFRVIINTMDIVEKNYADLMKVIWA